MAKAVSPLVKPDPRGPFKASAYSFPSTLLFAFLSHQQAENKHLLSS